MSHALTFQVTKVFILQSDIGPDHVYITTSEPSPCPGLSEEPLDLKLTVAAGGGPAYIRALGVPDELVEARKQQKRDAIEVWVSARVAATRALARAGAARR